MQGYYSFISAIHVVFSLPCLFTYLLIHLDKVDLYLGAVSGELISIKPSFFIIHFYLMFWVGYRRCLLTYLFQMNRLLNTRAGLSH